MSHEKAIICLHVQFMEEDQAGSNYAVYFKFLVPQINAI